MSAKVKLVLKWEKNSQIASHNKVDILAQIPYREQTKT
jgi:hypothetical protein